MSFKLFIYYCALCGGWAALLAWLLVRWLGILASESALVKGTLTSGVLGVLLAAVIGACDALLNATGTQRLVRLGVCAIVGVVGGLLGGLLGEVMYENHVPRFIGWMVVGLAIGVSIGVFDLLAAISASQSLRSASKKVFNGVIGGVLGGLVGGVLFGLFMAAADRGIIPLQRSPLAVGLVILGLCIGLLIGLAQVILKEAWLKVESGFRAGRELILSKQETTIGRAEGCDIGLFGDATVERLHARIVLQGNRYLLTDAGTPGGTYLNDQRIGQPTPLHSGDAIRVGNSVLRFGERQKRAEERPAAPAARRPTKAHTGAVQAAPNPFENL